MNMSDTVSINLQDATHLLERVFANAGLKTRQAHSVASALVTAEAEGQAGHGFSRVADYVAQARSGKVNINAMPQVIMRGPASVLVDAQHGFAYPALDLGIDKGIETAKSQSIAIIAIANSHHCGALSVQVERIAAAGLIAIMVANTPKAIAPWGGSTALFGTNPIAFATPQSDGPPLVVDLSLSRVARGKVMAAKKAGQPIPEGWALDANGDPTTDPNAALNGTMVPIGEAKGTALALMVELLAASFTGSAFSNEAGSFFTSDGPAPRVGQTIIAINPAAQSNYLERTSELLKMIETTEGARLPGMRRLAAIKTAQTQGLNVPKHLYEAAQTLAG